MFIGKYNKSVILTYAGLFTALVGVLFSIEGWISYSIVCLIISGICDMFDGTIARMCKRDDEAKEFGIQIDSLVDIVSFLVLPYCIGRNLLNGLPIAFMVILILYVLAGIIRLAWFNINARKDKVIKYYTGLPVTCIAFILPLFYVVDLLNKASMNCVYMVLYFIVGIAFILNVKIPKLKGVWSVLFGIMALMEIVLVLILR